MAADLAGPRKVVDAPARQRFELPVDGQTAFLEYRVAGDVLTLVHTEVPPALAGRGLGGMLARAAFDAARERGQRVRIRCPFVRNWVAGHPEYADLVVA